ncbi:amidophosphoribosyltransferase [Candidatus Woesearchaeota archaeon CG08_land_8_20_14_0_20_47_9]|nr:MAG: amidophosphoribosyltransferase [Candidatus Woesearchaeota archaeon CG08_land_8_20_14_0_20_47_9]
MCGIVAIAGRGGVSKSLFVAMTSLQHRGQDAAGMAVYNEESLNLNVRKGLGLVGEVFSRNDIEELRGNLGIAHVRYPTAGGNDMRDAQPFMLSYPFGIAMASNGNTVNYDELRSMLNGTRLLNSACDLEVMLHTFSDRLSKTRLNEFSEENVFRAAAGFSDAVKGSYSVVAVIAGKGLMALRDQYGIKPLAIGVKDREFIIASESVALSSLGYRFLRDIEPGEVVFIDSSNNLHSKVVNRDRHAHCMFEWVYFARPESVIDGMSVYQARLNLGRELARLWRKTGLSADVVIPVPDTSRTAAIGLAEALGLPYREGLIKNRYIGRTFIMPSQDRRDSAVKLKLNTVVSEIKDKSLLVVDDSIVRGTTSRSIIRLLRDNGAKRVYLLSTCPPIRHPCFYGIDMAMEEELIASSKTVEEIQEHIMADRLVYQEIEGLKRALSVEDLCTACLDGLYPIKVPAECIAATKSRRCLDRKASQGDGYY